MNRGRIVPLRIPDGKEMEKFTQIALMVGRNEIGIVKEERVKQSPV